MGKKKEAPIKPDQKCWAWAETVDVEELTEEQLHTSYRIRETPCKIHHCRRNCKANPRCVNALGEGKWFQEIKDNYWYDAEDADAERRESGGFVGLKNLGATCYVNTFLQVWFHNRDVRKGVFEWTEELDENKTQLLTKPFLELRDSLKSSELDDLLAPNNVISHLQAVFALLQFGKRRIVDPTAFINSLGLDASSQQDAQEFSKLFMSLLEDSLSQTPFRKNFIQDQFLGRYQYVTRCDGCRAVSRRPSQFYELDLNVKGNKSLVECIEEFLKEERLEKDNQYACSNCQSKQDAVRSISLQTLPPVLTLQLLRFVFDRKTGMKKKLSNFVEFGETLDMSQYCVDADSRIIYDLTAVLVHRGPSAYSGHYVAYIKDRHSRHWFKFNDEQIQRMGGRKLELGVEEDVDMQSVSAERPKPTSKGLHVSRDAYTLVYERRPPNYNDEESDEPPAAFRNEVKLKDLPLKLQRFVEYEDSKFEQYITQLNDVKKSCVMEGKKRQDEIKTLVELLPWTEGKEFAWISVDWLVHLLTTDITAQVKPVDNGDLLCPHGLIDPDKISKAKCISNLAAEIIYSTYKGGPKLDNTSLCGACVLKRAAVVRKRALIADDQKAITAFLRSKQSFEDETQCYWIGKQSLRCWKRLATDQILSSPEETNDESDKSGTSKPKAATIRVTGSSKRAKGWQYLPVDDGDTESAQSEFGFNEDTQCAPHDQLVLEESDRRLVPADIWHRLKRHFPNAPEYRGDAIPCLQCQDDYREEQNVKVLNVSVAMKQRESLANLLSDRKRPQWSDGGVNELWVVSDHFLVQWKKFIKDPERNDKPDTVGNKTLLCPHDGLRHEPAIMALSGLERWKFLTEEEWRKLIEDIPADIEIVITQLVDSPTEATYIANLDVCVVCTGTPVADEFKDHYTNAIIYVNRLETTKSETGTNGDNVTDVHSEPSPSTSSKVLNGHGEEAAWQPATVNGNGKRKLDNVAQSEAQKVIRLDVGRRKSSRTRREAGDKPISVTSTDTLRDLKLKVMERFSVAPFDQTLTNNGEVLSGDQQTLLSLNVAPGDRLFLRVDEPTEDGIFLDEPKNTVPEEGFKGTGLLGR